MTGRRQKKTKNIPHVCPQDGEDYQGNFHWTEQRLDTCGRSNRESRAAVIQKRVPRELRWRIEWVGESDDGAHPRVCRRRGHDSDSRRGVQFHLSRRNLELHGNYLAQNRDVASVEPIDCVLQ